MQARGRLLGSLVIVVGCGGAGEGHRAPTDDRAAVESPPRAVASASASSSVAPSGCALPGPVPFDLRSTLAVVRTEEDVVVAGSWSGTDRVARLETRCMTWSAMPSMASVRTGAGGMVQLSSGDLLVAGGVKGRGPWAERVTGGAWRVVQNDELDGYGGDLTALGDDRALWVGQDTFLFDGARSEWVRVARDTVDQSAVVLPDGDVLIVGAGRPSLIVDASSGAVSTVGRLPYDARSPALVALSPDGVLAAGGHGKQGDVADAAVYETKARTWRSIAPMTHARASHALVELPGGEIGAIGSANAEEVYAPSTGRWTSRPGPELFDVDVASLRDGRRIVFVGRTLLVRESDGGYRFAGGALGAESLFVVGSGAMRALGSLGALDVRRSGDVRVASSPGHFVNGVPLDDESFLVAAATSGPLARFDWRTGALGRFTLPKGITSVSWMAQAAPGVVLVMGGLERSERHRIMWVEGSAISLGGPIDHGPLFPLGNGRVLVLKKSGPQGPLGVIEARESQVGTSKATLPPNVAVRSACRLEPGRALLLTGPAGGHDAVDTVWLYDDATESLTDLGRLAPGSQDAACASVTPDDAVVVVGVGESVRVDVARRTIRPIESPLPGFRPYSAVGPAWETMVAWEGRLHFADETRGLISVPLPK